MVAAATRCGMADTAPPFQATAVTWSASGVAEVVQNLTRGENARINGDIGEAAGEKTTLITSAQAQRRRTALRVNLVARVACTA